MFGAPGLAWIAAGLVLLVAEILAPGVFMMWLGIAAIGTGLATIALGLAFAVEVVVFGVLAAAAIALGLRLRRARASNSLNLPGSGLVGRTVTPLVFQGREGRVRLGDSDWAARLAPGVAAPVAGQPLRVLEVDGTVLVVTPGI